MMKHKIWYFQRCYFNAAIICHDLSGLQKYDIPAWICTNQKKLFFTKYLFDYYTTKVFPDKLKHVQT